MSIEQIYQIPTYAHNLIDFPIGSLVFNKYSNVIYEVVEHTRGGISKVRDLNHERIDDYNSCNNRYFYSLSFIHPAIWSLII